MDRRVEIRRKLLTRLAELDEEIPQRTAALEEQAAQLRCMVAERRRTIRELDELDERKRHLRVIDGGKKAGAILAPILLLSRVPRQRIALAAASTAAVGGVFALAVVTVGAPGSQVHARAYASEPAAGVRMPASSGVVIASPSGIRQPTVAPSPSSMPATPAATVSPSLAAPAPSMPVIPSSLAPAVVVLSGTVTLPAEPSLPALPSSLPTLPSLPPSLPLPTPAGSCLVGIDLPPLAKACLL